MLMKYGQIHNQFKTIYNDFKAKLKNSEQTEDSREI